MRLNDENGSTLEVGEVKNCPFCGSSDELRITSRESYDKLVKKHGSSLIEISCRRCDISYRLYNIPDNNYDMGMGIMITKWNNRREAQG